jgi:fructuronate reductase
VTVTVTEKGYCWAPATRRLDVEHPDVRHDIARPNEPLSLPGHLVLAASDRRVHGRDLTVLSLDNLPSNGRTLQAVTLDLAAAIDPSLVPWITDHVRFPCSMVDRLVPATDDDVRAGVAAATGVEDAWPVRAERFSQWVVERDWAGPMPPLADVGVIVVDDVAPWELLKLRVLNGLHTSAAHLGLFHGFETVDRVVADPASRALLTRVAAEVTEVLVPPIGGDTAAYVATTMGRFANAGLGHRCAQIATDTSQKLPQRLLDTVRIRLDRDLPVDAIADVLALWAWSTLGRDHRGAPRQVQDPFAPTFAELAERHADDSDALAAALLSLEPIFGDLAGHAGLTTLVAARLRPLMAGRR